MNTYSVEFIQQKTHSPYGRQQNRYNWSDWLVPLANVFFKNPANSMIDQMPGSLSGVCLPSDLTSCSFLLRVSRASSELIQIGWHCHENNPAQAWQAAVNTVKTENAERGLCIGHAQMKLGILLHRTEIFAFALMWMRTPTMLFKWEHWRPLTIHQMLKFYFLITSPTFIAPYSHGTIEGPHFRWRYYR